MPPKKPRKKTRRIESKPKITNAEQALRRGESAKQSSFLRNLLYYGVPSSILTSLGFIIYNTKRKYRAENTINVDIEEDLQDLLNDNILRNKSAFGDEIPGLWQIAYKYAYKIYRAHKSQYDITVDDDGSVKKEPRKLTEELLDRIAAPLYSNLAATYNKMLETYEEVRNRYDE